jgi:DNA-directed RNA polymerase subunit beta
VRDVHYSHYGRICPVETPEGPNIGLISSPALYSRINHLGFIETPYIKVDNGVVTDRVDFLVPDEDDEYTIAQANVGLSKKRQFTDELVFARRRGEFIQVPPEEVDYMDVSPQQLVSVSAALIPFLEHDDANRALMGSNMQRQAVPLLTPKPCGGHGSGEVVADWIPALRPLAPFDVW